MCTLPLEKVKPNLPFKKRKKTEILKIYKVCKCNIYIYKYLAPPFKKVEKDGNTKNL